MTEESETYNSSVAGIDIEATRAGVGVGPTQVLAAIGDRFTFTESKVGFPMLSQTTIPDDKILMVCIRSATPGSGMCEVDLELATKYFRIWAMEEAHRRLLHNDAHAETVTEVARGFGFNHLGRFSVQYKAIYGESPRTTLRTDFRRLSLV